MTVKKLFYLIVLVTAVSLYIALPNTYRLNFALGNVKVDKQLTKVPIDSLVSDISGTLQAVNKISTPSNNILFILLIISIIFKYLPFFIFFMKSFVGGVHPKDSKLTGKVISSRARDRKSVV